MNRLVARASELRAHGQRGLAPYVTAGDGGFDATLAVLRACDRAGASCVELGIPFSDPIADGPVLQQSAQRALRAGATFDGAMETIARLRRGSGGAAPSAMPVLVMSYVNPLLVRGWSRTMRAIADAGGDGVLVADLPVEESDEMRAAAADAELATVFFVAPTTSDERAARAVRASRGFLYAIGRFGVTGAATHLDDGAQEFLARVRAAAGDLPVAVGFGIQDARGVRAATREADLAIVGSALMAHVHRARVSALSPFDGAETAGDGAEAAGRAAYECVQRALRGADAMNAERRRELRELDRALLALCDERARLLATFAIDDPGRASAVEDLLRRYAGPLDADLVRALFAAIDRVTGASSDQDARDAAPSDADARGGARREASTRDGRPEEAP